MFTFFDSCFPSSFFFLFLQVPVLTKESEGCRDIGIVHIAIDSNFSRFYRWYFIATPCQPPSLPTGEFFFPFFFFPFFTTNKSADDGSGQVCGPILRVIPVSCSTARFDDSNPFRGETQKETRSSSTTIHTACPRQCVYLHVHARMRTDPFLSNICPPNAPLPLSLRTKMKTATEGRGKKRREKEIVSVFRERIFLAAFQLS